ncbi:MAG TPA: DUF3379 family protein [Steroidobacteraceae bacterium]|nr:DUF3379 family protein [Steroidobacteraceae bacterium]
MIDCSHYRRASLAEPQSADPELLAHRDQCAPCAEFTERLVRFEARLASAMRLELGAPAGGAGKVVPLRAAAARVAGRRDRLRPRWVALAASMLVAVGVAGLLWLAVPRSSLADAVVAHMAGEPQAWLSNEAVPASRLSEAIRDAHLTLRTDAGVVSYAASCEFRGFHVPHLVVQDASGPVTVMVLVHESARATVNFDEQGYRGVIRAVPGHGAIAVLTRNRALSGSDVERIAARVQDAIEWTS